MRTTLTIDDKVVAELMKRGKTKNPAEAIRRALEEHLWHKRFEELLELAGQKPLRDDYTNEALEEEQIRDAQRYERRSRAR
jgi:Arc/MetJ family transcription regulator